MALMIVALAAMLFFSRLGARALWSSEGRWAEIAREMRLTSNYFWPTINGKLYYDKPLLSYWLVLAAADVTGAVNEAAARLPCAIAGLIGVALTMILARRFYDRRTAMLAGVILATSYSFVFFSRHASADVETVTGELATVILFLRYRERPNGWLIVAAWMVMAVTSLTKGLLGFVLPILVIGAYSKLAYGYKELITQLRNPRTLIAWGIERNRWLFNWATVPAIAIAGIIYYLPFAVSHARMHSEAGIAMVFRENIMRFLHPFDHRGPVYLYFGAIFALMAPWSLFLPSALIRAHTESDAGEGRGDRFTLIYFWATFVFFTLSGSRRSYYLLPILPAAAILVASLFTAARDRVPTIARRLMVVGYFLLIAAVVLGVAILIPRGMRPGHVLRGYPASPAPIAFAMFWLITMGGVVYALRDFRPLKIAISTAIAAYLALAYLFIFAMPGVERYRGEQPFAQAVRAQLKDDLTGLAMYKVWGPGLVFYLSPERPIPEFEQPEDLKKFATQNPVRWLIVRERDLPTLPFTGSPLVKETVFPWEERTRTSNKYLLIKIDTGSAPNPRTGN
ncbi:MAG: glycosyltransferase family 39 protein [Candidatus Binataceae bacterium]|jgi:4-amino-4-deoxy-L-arabinose transferase-like glycosyltransferase